MKSPRDKARSEMPAATPRSQISDQELRASVGESFNIFQATVAMCSIFMGFVFAGLLQLLGSDVPLTAEKRTAVWVLVVALLFLLGSLIGFHVTANQVLRYWSVFFPSSAARTVASLLFQLGIVAMLLAVAIMLFSKDMQVLGSIVGVSAACLVPLVFRVGRFHRGAPYVRVVDGPKRSKSESA